ncbi:hypothetical protein IAT40_004747 [Kwoniella sp. CBS 6097]
MSEAESSKPVTEETLPSDYQIVYPPTAADLSADTESDGLPAKEAWLSTYTRPDEGTTLVLTRRGMACIIHRTLRHPTTGYMEEVPTFYATRRGSSGKTNVHNPLDHFHTLDKNSTAAVQTVTHESDMHQGTQAEDGFFPIFNKLRELSFDNLGPCALSKVRFGSKG